MLSRKHYIAIAEAIAKAGMIRPHCNPTRADWYETKETVLATVTEELSLVLKRDNPRFNPRRFFDACGVEYDY